MLKVKNKETRSISMTSFEQVNAGWDLVFQQEIRNKYCCTVQGKACRA